MERKFFKYFLRNLGILICLLPLLTNAQNIIVQSDFTGTGSLIIDTTGVSYSIEVQRHIHSGNWHLISSPVSGQQLGAFVSANFIVENTAANDFDLAPYDEALNGWAPYTASSNTNTFDVARGYSTRRSTSGTIVFAGNANMGTYTIPVKRDNFGWNAVGNPYTSTIRSSGVGGFFDVNKSIMDPSYIGLYVWDQSINDYSIIVDVSLGADSDTLDQPGIAVGQGYIIKAKEAGNITFNRNMQFHTQERYVEFKSATIHPAKIELQVQVGVHKNTTLLYLRKNSTEGLDPGLDVGKLKGNPNIALYSQLPEDNGVEFAIQSIPDNELNDHRIPIGLDLPGGGFVTFTVDYSNLPANAQLILEDTESNTFKRLDEQNGKYETLVDQGTKGFGRFYLHTSNALVTDVEQLQVNDFRVYTRNKNILIYGDTAPNDRFRIYSLDGKMWYNKNPDSANFNTVDASALASGVYLLHIEKQGKTSVHKIVLSGN